MKNNTIKYLAIAGLVVGIGTALYIVLTTKPTKKERRNITVKNTRG
jgi:hypothetical protein